MSKGLFPSPPRRQRACGVRRVGEAGGRGGLGCLTLFFTDVFFSTSSMSRTKWNTCGLRIPRTLWQRQDEGTSVDGPGRCPHLHSSILAPL